MKLLLTYYIFIIFLVIVLGGIFYKHSTSVFEANAYSNISVISDKMSQQLENLIHPMDFKTTELLSDQSFISSLTSLATVERNDLKNLVYINDARQTIYGKLLTYSIDKNFYRVSVFNNKGDFLSGNFRTQNISSNLLDVINYLSWKREADNAKGKMILLPPYIDPWTFQGIKVFGVARSVQWPSPGMGYIEIQKPYSELQKIFEVPDSTSTKVVAVTNSGEVFYSGNIEDKNLIKYYASLAATMDKSVSAKKNDITGKDEIVVGASSDYTGIKIILTQDKTALFKPLFFTAQTTFMFGVLIIIVSFIYIYILSKQLSKPLKLLKEKMENTKLNNLPDEIVFESSHNEIEALNNSFQSLRERLNEAVRREMKAQSLQMRANFDSLQAQVNPHFIFNILNVLSNKGIENGDDEICEICEGIAAMLRYSTSTLSSEATIEEELNHVSNYLMLMKKRYEHRLEFNIDVDKAIYKEPIPKIVLQQIVENSVNHGFEKGQKIVRIDIIGYVLDGWWYIEFMDNGGGFETEVLNELSKRMECMRSEIIKGESKIRLAIGGMGLINTFGRLVLFYNNNFILSLKNADLGGAQVVLGSSMGILSEEDIK